MTGGSPGRKRRVGGVVEGAPSQGALGGLDRCDMELALGGGRRGNLDFVGSLDSECYLSSLGVAG